MKESNKSKAGLNSDLESDELIKMYRENHKRTSRIITVIFLAVVLLTVAVSLVNKNHTAKQEEISITRGKNLHQINDKAGQSPHSKYELWGGYERGNSIPDSGSSGEKWKWKVVVIEKGTAPQDLVEIAKQLAKDYPSQRIRIFDDKEKIQQYVDRDIYFNDMTGRAKEVDFPADWVIRHHVANINDRSEKYEGRWQLVTRYGQHIALL